MVISMLFLAALQTPPPSSPSVSTSVGLCETTLTTSAADIAGLATTFGFQRTALPNGQTAWVHQAGANRTLIAPAGPVCVVAIKRGAEVSAATAVFRSWAQDNGIAFSSTPSGDLFGQMGRLTYRYRELAPSATGTITISRGP